MGGAEEGNSKRGVSNLDRKRARGALPLGRGTSRKVSGKKAIF